MTKYFLVIILISIGIYSKAQDTEAIARNAALSKRYTFNYASISVNQLLDTLKKGYDFTLYYSSTNLDLTQQVKVNYKNITIEELFDKLFFKTRIQFTIVKDKIVLKHFDGKLYQNVRGVLLDSDNKEPLMMASIAITSTSPQMGGYALDDGTFVIYDVPIGRHIIQASILGYHPVIITDALVQSGKELYLKIEMDELVSNLDEVIISPGKSQEQPINNMATGSVRKFSTQEAKRYAAGISDPARMSQSFAGTALATDGLFNEVTIRGNSPKGIVWKMEGLNVPSPSHFNREGSTGGLISMLNSSTMSNSDFYTGVFPAEYGNALAGVYDIKLRSGNSTKKEHEAKVGILGFEFGSEGPLKKGSDATYLFNYRYSTSSLLINAGLIPINFGVPLYWDGSYKFYIPTKKFGVFSFFGLNGEGKIPPKNEVEADSIKGQWHTYYVDFALNTYINGVRHNYIFNDKLFISTTLGLIGRQYKADAYRLHEHHAYQRGEDLSENYRTSSKQISSYLNFKANNKNTFRLGGNIDVLHYDMNFWIQYKWSNVAPYQEDGGVSNWIKSKGVTKNTQLYLQWKHKFSNDLKMNVGLNVLRETINNELAFDPRFSLSYKQSDRLSWVFATGHHSKQEALSTLFLRRNEIEKFKNLKLYKSIHTILGNTFKINDKWIMKNEIYSQNLYDVGVESEHNYPFSMLNMYELYTLLYHDSIAEMESTGKGWNYGYECTLERYFRDDYYLIANGTVYKSLFSNSEGDWFPTVFDYQSIIKLATGKEWKVGKDKRNTIGLNMRITRMGGKRFLYIDMEESLKEDREIIDFQRGYEEMGNPFFKMDFAMNYIFNRKRTTHEFKLDVYNVSNAQIQYKSRYDRVLNEKIYDNYLDILPFITYSVKW